MKTPERIEAGRTQIWQWFSFTIMYQILERTPRLKVSDLIPFSLQSIGTDVAASTQFQMLAILREPQPDGLCHLNHTEDKSTILVRILPNPNGIDNQGTCTSSIADTSPLCKGLLPTPAPRASQIVMKNSLITKRTVSESDAKNVFRSSMLCPLSEKRKCTLKTSLPTSEQEATGHISVYVIMRDNWNHFLLDINSRH